MAVKNKDDRIYKTDNLSTDKAAEMRCCFRQMFKMLWVREAETDQMLTGWLEPDVLSCYRDAKGALGEPCTIFISL